MNRDRLAADEQLRRAAIQEMRPNVDPVGTLILPIIHNEDDRVRLLA
jgi:hypothetical protein